MLAPSLESWVKQRNLLLRRRIETGDSVGLVTIAKRAGKPEVRFFAEATSRPGQKVLNFKTSHHEPLGAQAISATIARIMANTPPNFGCGGRLVAFRACALRPV
jgi:hypothetical protein